MKRFLTFILAALVLLGTLPITETAAETVTPDATSTVQTQEPAQVISQQLMLGDDLNMRFWVEKSADQEESALTMYITVGENTQTVPFTDVQKDTDGSYIFDVALAATQMTDRITLQVHGENVTGTAKQYSVYAYAKCILNGNYSEYTTELVRTLLNYGAAAQVFFAYNSEELANAGYESTPSVTVPTEDRTVAISGNTESVKFYGASLIFRDRIAIRYYFTGNVSGYTFQIENREYTPVQKNGMYYVELADICPQDYSTVYTLTVSGKDESMQIGYSAMHYIVRMHGGSDEKRNALLQWLYAYHISAMAYQEWVAAGMDLTDYTVVYPDNATELETTARDVLISYIQKSTGVTLPMIPASEAQFTNDVQYLIVGDTGLCSNDLSTDELGSRGYRITNKGNSLIVRGNTDFGTLCGVIGLLEKVIDLQAYGPQTVTYESKKEIRIEKLDVTEIPDIDQAQPPFALVSGNKLNQALWKVGIPNTFGLIEGSANHWHNSFDYLPPEEYAQEHPNYYVYYDGEPVQLSYTANGNESDFAAMTEICAQKIIAAAENNPDMKMITLTQQDTQKWDNSLSATASYLKYGTHSAEVIQFVNAVAEKVKAALPAERELVIYFFAYYSTKEPPVKLVDGKYTAIDSSVVLADNVGVMYAPIGADYTVKDISATELYQELSGWAALTDHIALWTYQTDFGNYFNFTNTFNSMSGLFRAAQTAGVNYIYHQGQWNNGNATGFSHLKTYLSGKLSWDANADVDGLISGYFANRFGNAAEEMKSLFNAMRVYCDENGAISKADKQTLEAWLQIIKSAYAKESNSTIQSYITLESLAIRYWLIENYGNSMTADEYIVAVHGFKKDCAALNISMFNESKTLSTLWEKWEDGVITKLEDVIFDFDLSTESEQYTFDIPEKIGEVTAVYNENFQKLEDGVTVGADTITFTKNVADMLRGSDSYGDYIMYLANADCIYQVNAAVVTKLIYSYDDLVAIKANQVDGVLDGYYALAADINAKGCSAISLIDFSGYVNNKENSTKGFAGIFDGRGHTVSDLTVKTGGYAQIGGLFGQILRTAQVRNVAFADMTTDGGKYAYLLTGESCRMIGTISNVVIAGKGNAEQVFGFIGCDPSITANAERGSISNLVVSGVNYLSYTIMNVPTLENVIAVTEKALCVATPSNEGDKAVYDTVIRYANNEALFSALETENVLTEWTDSNISYDRSAVFFGQRAIITLPMNIEQDEAVIGTSTVLTVEGDVTLSLKTAVEGVTLEGVTLYVDNTVAEGTKITLIATSNATGTQKEFTLTLHRDYTEEQTQITADMENSAENVQIDISTVEGTVECFIYGDKTVYTGYSVSNHTLTLSAELISQMYAKLGYGEHTVFIGTNENVRYAIKIVLATKIIRTVDDLLSISTSEASLDGYYILAADLDCAGSTVTLLSGKQSTYGTTNIPTVGFKGTFDGRGHIISNLHTANGAYRQLGGVFGQICEGAVVKNVAFVNIDSDSPYLLVGDGSRLHGTLENVAVIGKNASKTVLADLSSATGKLHNCFFANVSQISSGGSNASVGNILSVTANATKGYGGFAWSGNATYNAKPNYATVNELVLALTKNNILEAWENSMLSFRDGKILFNGIVLVQYQLDLQGETTIFRGTSQTYLTGDSDLELEKEIDGVTLEWTDTDEKENDIYTLTVSAAVPVGTQIVIIARSWDDDTLTNRFTVTVKALYQDVDMTAHGSIGDIELTADGFLSVPDFITESLNAISYGDGAPTSDGVSFENGKIRIAKTTVEAMAAEMGLGEQTVYLYTDNDHRYAVTVTLATKVISTWEELAAIAVTGNTLNGYYVLAADIDCEGHELKLVGTWGNSTTTGFIGTFDGRGHSISNVKVQAAGLFGYTGAGTIRDLALIDVQGSNNAFASEVHGTKLENIFISSESCLRAMTYTGSTTIRNVIALLPNGQQMIETFGSATESNTISHAYTVITNPVTNDGWSGTKVVGLFRNYYKNDDPKALYDLRHDTDVEELFLALDTENTVAEWDSLFRYEAGKLYFANRIVCQATVTVEGEKTVIRGTSQTYTSTGILSVKEAINGVSLVDGVLSVDGSVPVDTVITLVATHSRYPNITAEWNVQVSMVYEQIDLTALGSIGDLETADSYSEIRLPEQINGKVIGISIGESAKNTSAVSVSDGVLYIENEWVTKAYDAYGHTEQNIMLYTDTDKCYTVTVAIVTKVLENQADLLAISTTEPTLYGYYVLGNDIGCDGTTVIRFVNNNTQSNNSVGFFGTFDGRGHTISDLTTSSKTYNGLGGLFGMINTGAVVKNVAFVNMSADGYGILLCGESRPLMGTVENVVVHARSNENSYVFANLGQTSGVLKNSLFLNVKCINKDGGAAGVSNIASVTATDLTKYGGFAWSGNATFNAQKNFASNEALLAALESENFLNTWTDSTIRYADGKLLFNGIPLFFTETNLEDPADLGDLQTSAKETAIRIPAELTGNIIGISAGDIGRTSEGVAYANGILSLKQSTVQALATAGYGDRELKLYTDEGKCYAVSACIVTKIVNDQADLQSIATGTTIDGYYVLGSDVECDGTTVINLSCYTSSATAGFIGTFDGRGHSISNVNVGNRGLFYGIGAGTVKNLALIHVIGTKGALAQEVHGSTFENLFISGDTPYIVDTNWHDPAYRNVVFVSSGTDARIFREGSTGTLTMENVFTVGAKVHGYYGATTALTNAQCFADADALLAAIGAEGELDKWTDSSFTCSEGILYFNGKSVVE